MTDDSQDATGMPDATCPYCGISLTPENVFNRPEGTAPAVVAADVPGVDEEHDVPVYVLQCVNCLIEGNQRSE